MTTENLYDALKRYEQWIGALQSLVTSHIKPDGIKSDEFISEVIQLLDGPYQRAVQKEGRDAIKQYENKGE